MGNEQSRNNYFPNGIERYLSKPEESNGGEDDNNQQNQNQNENENEDEIEDEEDEIKDEIESVINSSPSPSTPDQSQGEQAKTGESGDELPHPGQHPGDVWPDQPWDADWFEQGALTPIEDNEYVGDYELYLDISHQYENKDRHGSEGQNYYGSNDGDDLEPGYDEVTVTCLAIDERDKQLDAGEGVDDINITLPLSLWTAIQDEVRRKEQDKKREEGERREREEELRCQVEKDQDDEEDENYISELEATAEDLDFSQSGDDSDQDYDDSASNFSALEPDEPNEGESGRMKRVILKHASSTVRQINLL